MNASPTRYERWRALRDMERWLDKPMAFLALVWLALAVIELTRGLSGELEFLGTAIWIVFVLDFALRLVLAPSKRAYVARNWLTALSLLVPVLRLLRVLRAMRLLRAARALRGVRLVKIVSTVNRSMKTLGRNMRRRRLGYVLVLTAVVIMLGAAGMFAFERVENGAPMASYAEALWWTSMVITTLGPGYWPRTPEGRVILLLLSMCAIGVFGYMTASLATFFLGQDAANRSAQRIDSHDRRRS